VTWACENPLVTARAALISLEAHGSSVPGILAAIALLTEASPAR